MPPLDEQRNTTYDGHVHGGECLRLATGALLEPGAHHRQHGLRASYHNTNNGHYSANLNYLATTGVDSSPLHALANGVSGRNGVYAYGSTSLFPTQTWSAANYWPDVMFQL